MSDDLRSGPAVDPRAVRATLSPAPQSSNAIVMEPGSPVIVDGAPLYVRLERRDPTHAILLEGAVAEARSTALVIQPLEAVASGTVRREVMVDGWRIVVDIEPEQRASLRERARLGRDQTARTGRSELRAVIPGRILTVSVAPGDRVTAGQQVMAVEAMKMQNELRAPRDGIVASVEVGPGKTVEVGDLLLVLE